MSTFSEAQPYLAVTEEFIRLHGSLLQDQVVVLVDVVDKTVDNFGLPALFARVNVSHNLHMPSTSLSFVDPTTTEVIRADVVSKKKMLNIVKNWILASPENFLIEVHELKKDGKRDWTVAVTPTGEHGIFAIKFWKDGENNTLRFKGPLLKIVELFNETGQLERELAVNMFKQGPQGPQGPMYLYLSRTEVLAPTSFASYPSRLVLLVNEKISKPTDSTSTQDLVRAIASADHKKAARKAVLHWDNFYDPWVETPSDESVLLRDPRFSRMWTKTHLASSLPGMTAHFLQTEEENLMDTLLQTLYGIKAKAQFNVTGGGAGDEDM